MTKKQYQIETRVGGLLVFLAACCGDADVFGALDAAEGAISDLGELGDEWLTAEYRILDTGVPGTGGPGDAGTYSPPDAAVFDAAPPPPCDPETGEGCICDDQAFSCDALAACGGHKCNLADGCCVWPCRSDTDCRSGYLCAKPNCIPAPAD